MRITLTLAILAVALTACQKPADNTETPASSVSPASVPTAEAMPADEAAFIALPRGSENIPVFCAAYQKMGDFTNWTGHVGDVRVSSVDKAAAIEFVIGGKVHLDDVVQADDPIYKTIMTLEYGQAVRLSGAFGHGNGNADCNYVYGPFGVRLTAIAPQ